MASIRKINPYVWLILFSMLMLFSGGKWSVPVAAWVAPVLGLLYITSVRHFWRGTLLLFIATYIPLLFSWYGIVPFPMPIYPVFMLVNAIMAVLPYVLTRLVMNRINLSFAGTLIFPIIATGIEFMMMGSSPLGSIGALAYTQYGFDWIVQTASISGLWGIAFLVSWFAATVVWSIQSDAPRPQKFIAGIVYGVVLVIAVGFGFYRLSNQPAEYETAKMAGITAQSIDMHQLMTSYNDNIEIFREETQAIHTAYINATREAINADAQLIMWAELAGIGIEADVIALQSDLQQIAQENSIYLAVPVFILFPDEPERPAENRLYVIDPNGEIVLDHVKYGGNVLEGTLPGDAILQVVNTPFGRLSGVICWDTDFPDIIRQAGELNVDILLSPAYVWDEYAKIHFEMATFRAIENGMTLIRQSDHGYSGVINSYGSVLSRVDSSTSLMLVDVPINAGISTVFPTTGTLVGQASLMGLPVLLVLAIASGFMRRRRASERDTIADLSTASQTN